MWFRCQPFGILADPKAPLVPQGDRSQVNSSVPVLAKALVGGASIIIHHRREYRVHQS